MAKQALTLHVGVSLPGSTDIVIIYPRLLNNPLCLAGLSL